MEAVGYKELADQQGGPCSVTGKVARQQCQGELQLPLSDLGAVALDYRGKAGIATSIGHAPQVAMIDPGCRFCHGDCRIIDKYRFRSTVRQAIRCIFECQLDVAMP